MCHDFDRVFLCSGRNGAGRISGLEYYDFPVMQFMCFDTTYMERDHVSSGVITFQNMSISQKEEEAMSKKKCIPAVFLIGTFVILFMATFFLPDKIPFHFDADGEAGWYASKYFILLLTPVPYLIYHQFSHKKK